MTFYDALKQMYVGKTIKSIVQKNAPTFHSSILPTFHGKKIVDVRLDLGKDPECNRICFYIEGGWHPEGLEMDCPLSLYFHENIELE